MNTNLYHAGIDEPAAPTISVVMPVYNGAKYLAEAIDSILAQTFRDFELIIIDDGSTDDSLRILQDYQKRDVRIRLISRENRDLATTLNEAIDLARGTWIARMDQDDIALPQRFERQLSWLEKTGADITGSWVRIFGSWDRRTWKCHQTDQAIKMELLFNSPFFHPSVMMRTHLVRQLKYDKKYEKGEDFDLWVRAAQAGWKMSNVPEVLLLYRKHATQITTVSSDRLLKVGEEVKRKYWSFMTDLMGLRQEGVQEIFKIGKSPAKPDLDIAETTLRKLLLQNKGEARKAIMDNVFRLYVRECANCPDIGDRWEKLNRLFGQGPAFGRRFMLWFIRVFKLRYGGSMFKQMKRIYTYLLR